MTLWLPATQARERTSAKWAGVPPDALALSTAEMDCVVAPSVRRTLRDAVDSGDLGYRGSDLPLRAAFVAFAGRRWDWHLTPDDITLCTDVSAGIVESLRRAVTEGDRVVLTPPVYGPFTEFVAEAGAEPEPVPLLDDGSGWALDLSGIRAALEGGARAVLICNPHNPTGTVHTREDLAALAAIAREHHAVVISDEIHAPLTHPGATFTPFLDSSPDAPHVGVVVTSASKGWNLAGLKCALVIGTGPEGRELMALLPRTVGERSSILGARAATAAFNDSDEWLDAITSSIAANARRLASLLDHALPQIGYRTPDAGYLAWLDCRRLPWGTDPAATLQRSAGVILSNGSGFGMGGAHHARLNFGCAPETLELAIDRIASTARGSSRG